MQKFQCLCNEIVFFDNSQCVSCMRELGFCPVCQRLVALIGTDDIGLQCGNSACGAALRKCYNYRAEGVCNRCILADDLTHNGFCDCCRFNAIIPDLSKGDNRRKWLRLEQAKRRAFYYLDLLGLPRGNRDDGFNPPLAFEFKEPATHMVNDPGSHAMPALLEEGGMVMTGHLNGTITINIHEADPVERERLRVMFGERNRSLVGHFRHELAHYYWDLLIRNKHEADFAAVFGDPYNPPYQQAIDRYYRNGPPDDWRLNYTSAYASMHPWEDFAETFAAYLEIVSVLDTAHHMGINSGAAFSSQMDTTQMVGMFIRLGTILNEINRGMGLKALLTRSFQGPVVDKLRYVQKLINRSNRAVATSGAFHH